MEPMKLTFEALDAKIEAVPQSTSAKAVFPKKAKWGYSAAAVGALFSFLCVELLPSKAIYTLVLASIGLVVEIAGVIVAGISQMPKTWPTFASERRDFAKQLDFDLPHHLALVGWLRTFPLDQRETLSEFVSYRHDRMQEKLPMLTGSIEKIGALPIVIALYLQFKDMQWPPHPSWLEALLIFALVFGYWLSVMQISVRLRLHLYDKLLSKSLTEPAADNTEDKDRESESTLSFPFGESAL